MFWDMLVALYHYFQRLSQLVHKEGRFGPGNWGDMDPGAVGLSPTSTWGKHILRQNVDRFSWTSIFHSEMTAVVVCTVSFEMLA